MCCQGDTISQRHSHISYLWYIVAMLNMRPNWILCQDKIYISCYIHHGGLTAAQWWPSVSNAGPPLCNSSVECSAAVSAIYFTTLTEIPPSRCPHWLFHKTVLDYGPGRQMPSTCWLLYICLCLSPLHIGFFTHPSSTEGDLSYNDPLGPWHLI